VFDIGGSTFGLAGLNRQVGIGSQMFVGRQVGDA